MSVTETLTRISEIQSLLAPRVDAAPADDTAASSAPVADLLAQSTAASAATVTPLGASAGSASARMLQIASAEVGQAEQPPGSNDSARIAQYRTATAGAGVGPWCAYFASWVANQAGVPLGEAGQGFGAVQSVAEWAQRTGRWTPAGAGTPQPGDLVVWGARHIGIVESVGADGSISTIEGNSSDRVSRRTYDATAGGATGFVRVG
ncbi:MAG: CHAP domain-containing protein [Solirubrobacterales bacterium]